MNPHITRRLDALCVLERYLRTARTPDSPVFRRRLALTDALIETSMPAPTELDPIAEVDATDLTVERFEALSKNYARPVILRGLARDHTAVQRWSLEYLTELVGDHEVLLYEQSHVDGESGITDVRTCRRPFRQFAEGLGTDRLYLNNSTELFLAFPELFDHLETDRLDARFGREAQATALFIGSEAVYSPLHAAVNGNFFMNVAGRKTWTFIEPRYLHFLLPIFAKPFAYMVTPWTYKTAEPDHHLWRVPHQSFTLEPGDGLYNAPWWWHEVRNEGRFVVGCAVRNRKRGWMRPFSSENWRSSAMLSGMSVLPLMETHYWSYKLRDALLGQREAYAQTFNRFAEAIVQQGLSDAASDPSRPT